MLGPSQQFTSKQRLAQSVALYYAIAIGWAWLVWTPPVVVARALGSVHTIAIFPPVRRITLCSVDEARPAERS